MSIPTLAPRARVAGAARRDLASKLAVRYESGESIRQLCASTGYSIGRVRGLLSTANITFRARGGRPRPSQPADGST